MLSLAFFAVIPLNTAHAQSSISLEVPSDNTNSQAISGYYIVLYQNSQVVTTGYTTAYFTLNSGETYEIQAGNYGSCTFDYWLVPTTGSANDDSNNPMTFTASANNPVGSSDMLLTAIYNCGASTSSSVTVNSVNQNNAAITGYYVSISDSSGTVARGYTPATFTTTSGGTYSIEAYGYGNCIFSNWSNGATTDPMTFTATATAQSFTAVYTCGSSGGGASQVTITSQETNGTAISGFYTELYASSGSVQATGFTPATFSTTSGNAYSVQVDGYGSCTFAKWSDGVTSNPRSFAATSSAQTFAAEYNCGSTSGGSSNGITVFDHRIPATYWADCFVTTCTNPLASCNTNCTGPGAAMYVVLYDSSGNVVGTGFANENGYTFTGLTAGVTYYIYPSDCDNCHGSTHDVLFSYWGTSSGAEINSTRPLAVVVGESVNDWYTCTNGCSGV